MASEAIQQSLFSWVDEAGATNTLDVDVVMSSKDRHSAKLTDHVVEDGAVITDHVVIQPESVDFELVVTQTPHSAPGFAPAAVSVTSNAQQLVPETVPIDVRASQFQPGGFLLLTSGLRNVVTQLLSGGGSGLPTSAQGSRAQQITSTTSVQTLQSAAPVNRVNDTHDALIEILNKALLVTLSFKGRLYIDYLLTEVELTESAGMFGCARFKVEARAFRTVTGTLVNLPDPEDFRALPAVSKGSKTTKTPDPDPAKNVARSHLIREGRDKEYSKGVLNAVNGLMGR